MVLLNGWYVQSITKSITHHTCVLIRRSRRVTLDEHLTETSQIALRSSRESSMVNILLFSFWPRILVASSFHCQRFRGQEGDYSKKKKETIFSADCLPAPLSKYTKMPRIFSEKNGQTACSVFSHKARKLPKSHILLRLLLHISLCSLATVLLLVSRL